VVEAVRHVEAHGIKPVSLDRKTGRITGDGDADALAGGGRTEYRR